MKNFKLCFALTFLYLFETISANPRKQQNVNFDHFVMAQQWPQTSCLALNNMWKKPSDVCTCKPPNFWTLHGLWPSKADRSLLIDCPTTMVFRSNTLKTELSTNLENKWRNYYKDSTNPYGFLSHEWKKHGSCATSVERTNNYVKYFTEALALLDHYNLGEVLAKKQIIPGKQYAFFDIYNSIREHVNANVHVRCINNPITKEQYLHEVHICVNKSFEPVDCNDSRHISNCSYNNKVVYPQALNTC